MSTQPINVNGLFIEDFYKDDYFVSVFVSDGELNEDEENRFVSIGSMRLLSDGSCVEYRIEMKPWTKTPKDALAVMRFTMDAVDLIVKGRIG